MALNCLIGFFYTLQKAVSFHTNDNSTLKMVVTMHVFELQALEAKIKGVWYGSPLRYEDDNSLFINHWPFFVIPIL